ncbi:AHH domain-containing protein [Bradyrhizobium sp. 1(2017)]|uniref:AHH domain-containing protein n=1 Tax=Bradyrhizobium sp. 1(2017) TaxID=1404888 RepID=UPI00140F3146|nr:AHH domain-containing protein [Bradyrhizobium sp. 1(2017)]QIO32673.1 hypothetical protein HAP40_13120 [Bradyrhizobium sp. 1(2017)]
MLQDHHVLPQKFAGHEVVRLLRGRFDHNSVQNLVTLPSKQLPAKELGSSPHTGGHLGTYYKGFCDYLEELKVSPKFVAASAGDARALDEIASDVNAFVAAAKYAVANGHLLPNTPEGVTTEEANGQNHKWFSNAGKYAADNAEQIQRMRETVDQFDNAGRQDAALAFPILSPTSGVSMAERIEILKRLQRYPISLQFTAVDPVPALPGLVPSLIDTRLRGFSPPAHSDQNAREGFTPSDPRLAGQLPAFPAPNRDEQQFDQLPPTAAAPLDPLVLRSDPASGTPLPFYDNPLAGGSSVTQNALPWLAGAAAAGVATPFIPAWLLTLGGILALSRAASAQDSGLDSKIGAATPGGVFSTRATAFNTLPTGLNMDKGGSSNAHSVSRFGLHPGGVLSLDPEAHASSFADRFGNWTSTPNDIAPAEGLPEAVPMPSAGSVPPEDIRRLARVNASNAGSVFTSGSEPVPYLPSTEFNERFGSWTVPTADGRPTPASKPIAAFGDEPSYLIPPPIFGVESTGNPHKDAEEWFSRWIRPLIRPE